MSLYTFNLVTSNPMGISNKMFTHAMQLYNHSSEKESQDRGITSVPVKKIGALPCKAETRPTVEVDTRHVSTPLIPYAARLNLITRAL
jgi:hypothetical protein